MSEPPDNVTIAPVTPDASFAKLAWTPSTPILAAITQQPPSNVVYAVAAAPAPIDLLQTLEPSSDDSDCCPRRSLAVHPATTTPDRRYIMVADATGGVGITVWNANVNKFGFDSIGKVVQLGKVVLGSWLTTTAKEVSL
jgi:hypothetical protein